MSKDDSREQIKFKKYIKISATGNIDLEITLTVTSDEADYLHIFPNKISNLKDCEEFLQPIMIKMQELTNKQENKLANIFDYVRLSSNNTTINSLIIMNKTSKKKAFIEFITLSELKFSEEVYFLKEFVQ